MPHRAHAPALLAAAFVLVAGCGEGTPEPPRHLVVVVADTLRADRLGLYGHARDTSPELARWAARGAVFERAFATSPWTLPSFASLLTGLPPARHGAGAALAPEAAHSAARTAPVVGMRLHGEARWFRGLDPNVPTLAERLRRAGFETAAFVNNPFLDRRFGLARGFDHWDHEPGGDEVSRRADEMIDRFLAWRDASAASRSFALLHFFDPHMSYDAPPPFGGRYRATDPAAAGARFEGPVRDTSSLRAAAPELDAADRAYVAAAYDEELAFVDAQLGRLLDALAERGRLETALVVFTSDHGEELFEHGGFGHGHAVTDELLRVPLVFWGAGVRPGPRETPASIADLPATLLDAAGLPVPGGDVSLWPLLTGRGAVPERVLVAENPGSEDGAQVALEWPWKLVRVHRDGAQREALYDLAADPAERRDLAAEHPERRRRLAARLEALEAGGRAVGAPVEIDPELEERLRGLGYID